MRALLCAVVTGALCAAPAAAATAPIDGNALGAKIVGAMSKVQSFRLEMSGPTGSGVAGTMTVEITPARRLRLVMAGNQSVSESISADGKLYSRLNGGGWTVQDISPTVSSDPGLVQSMMDATRIRALADRSEDGLTLGVFAITLAPPVGAAPQAMQETMTCTYDKTTFLPRTCANGYISEAFVGWNDAANAIVIPAVAGATPTPRPKK
jgi:hypothetical protein